MAGSGRSLPQPNPRPPQTVPLPSSLSPEVIQQLVNNQSKQLGLELKEQEIRLRELELGDSYAKASLTAQVQDRDNNRIHARELLKIRYRNWLIGGLAGTGIAAATIIGCVAYGQAHLALELVKTIGPPLVTAVAGVVGGYSVGLRKGQKGAKEDTEPIDSK